MTEAELNHFDSIVGKQAKVAELQARVMGEYLWGIGTELNERGGMGNTIINRGE